EQRVGAAKIARIAKQLCFGLDTLGLLLFTVGLQRAEITTRRLYVVLFGEHRSDAQFRRPSAVALRDLFVSRDCVVIALGLLCDLREVERREARLPLARP